jgi:hypothetical protein
MNWSHIEVVSHVLAVFSPLLLTSSFLKTKTLMLHLVPYLLYAGSLMASGMTKMPIWRQDYGILISLGFVVVFHLIAISELRRPKGDSE